MTKITKMQMAGFKSFAKKTELLFGDRYNCILGPNGSGKSNVGDALCFVLGRSSAKAMRAEKSANLIYNGGKSKQPAKFGEVAIYLDNSDKVFPEETKEVKISRTIKASGQSVYKINEKKSTRSQILDMLGLAKIDPDGFNIILQGDIVRFVEMPPIERRRIVEEISGISGYEDKKRKAMNELNKVEEKLNEADIILTERKTYLKELKKDRDQALKFKQLKDNIDTNKASYLHLKLKKKEKHCDELTKQADGHKAKLGKAEEEITSIKEKITEKKGDIDALSKEIEQKGEKEQVALHKQVETLKINLATHNTRIENCKNEVSKIGERRKQLKQELSEHEDQVKDIIAEKKALEKEKVVKEKELEHIEKEIEKFRKKHAMDNVAEIEAQIDEVEKEGEEHQKQIAEAREKQQNWLREKDRLELQIGSIDEKINKVLEVEKEHKSQVLDLKNKKELFKKVTIDLNKALNEDSDLSGRTGNARRKLAVAQEQLSKLEAQNIAAQEQLGEKGSMRVLRERIKGIHGTVGELGNVPSKYALALEIAAGNKIKFIVVEDDKVAAQCIKYLKDNRLGIAAFIPMNKIRAPPANASADKLKKSRGSHGYAVELMTFDPKFKKVFAYVFGNTLVVDDVATARSLGIGSTKMVTLDGDIIEMSGVMKGGFRQKKRVGGFKQDEIVKKLELAETNVAEQSQLLSTLEKRRKENEVIIVEMRKKKGELEGEIIKLEKSLHLEGGDLGASKKLKEEMKEQLKKVDKELDNITDEISEINRTLAQTKIKRSKLKEQISQLKNPRLVAELNAFTEKKTQVKERIIQMNAELGNFDAKMKLVNPEQNKIEEIFKQLDKEYEQFSQEIKTLKETIKKEDTELKEKEKQAQKFYAKYKELFNKRGKLGEEINKMEHKIDKMRDVSRAEEVKMNTVSLELAKIKAELSGLQEEFKQYEGVKLTTAKSEQELKSEIDRFERMMGDIGAVNMRALEVYDEIEKEYQALLDKKDKLGKEREDVLGMIEQVETKKKELFMKTLNVVGAKFQNIFKTMSKKGDAFLELENPKEIFEGGLNIKVKITGKKLLDIRSLSGGEKTMTALAFIFAIQEHEPHSFYILDEVDAALDKHNSEKLATLVAKYSERAQYIVISHNDSVISNADCLFGVSMNEHGMSQVTSLKI